MNALGDPGLLMPLFYHPRPKESKSEISLCPHYIHKEDFARVFSKSNSVKVIDVQRDLEDVIDDIVSSDICISTSLHGIIMSQAYGIPWVWLEIVDNNLKGDDFKFNDFFSTLNGSGFAHARVTLQELASLDIQSLAKTAFLPEKKYDEESMLKALDEWLLNTGERAGVESLR